MHAAAADTNPQKKGCMEWHQWALAHPTFAFSAIPSGPTPSAAIANHCPHRRLAFLAPSFFGTSMQSWSRHCDHICPPPLLTMAISQYGSAGLIDIPLGIQ